MRKNVTKIMTLKEFRKKLFSPIVYWNLLAMVLFGIVLCVGLWYGYRDHKALFPFGHSIRSSDNAFLLCDRFPYSSYQGFQR